jgi:hypothetical protein
LMLHHIPEIVVIYASEGDEEGKGGVLVSAWTTWTLGAWLASLLPETLTTGVDRNSTYC